jgi:serine/threonine protein kinase
VSLSSSLKGLLSPGEVIANRYEVIAFLARGAHSELYTVSDTSLDGQELVLKLFDPMVAKDPRTFTALQQELLTNRTLRHPNILQLLDAGLSGGVHTFITLEYVDGCTLTQLLSSCRATDITIEEAVYVFIELAAGLSYAHQHDIVHRCLYPGQALISRRGDLRIKGCGSSAVVGRADAKQSREIISFAAPETKSSGIHDILSNQYSLGVMLYSMLVGTEMVYAAAERKQQLPDLRGLRALPTWVGELVLTCVQLDRKRRFQTMEQAALFVEAQANVESLEAAARERLSKRIQELRRVTRKTRPSAVHSGRHASRFQAIPREFKERK